MNDIFRDQLGDFVVVFLDDIMVYSNTFKDHMRHVRIVLDKLREYKLFAKLSKCDFFQKEITYQDTTYLGRVFLSINLR